MERRLRLALVGVGVSVLAHWVVLDWMRTPQAGGLPSGQPLQVELRPKVQSAEASEAPRLLPPAAQKTVPLPDDERQMIPSPAPASSASVKPPHGAESVPVRAVPPTQQGQGSAPDALGEHGWRALTDEEAQVMVRLRLARWLAREQLKLDVPVSLELRRGSDGTTTVEAVGGSVATPGARQLVALIRQRLGQKDDLLPPEVPLPIEIECLPN